MYDKTEVALIMKSKKEALIKDLIRIVIMLIVIQFFLLVLRKLFLGVQQKRFIPEVWLQ